MIGGNAALAAIVSRRYDSGMAHELIPPRGLDHPPPGGLSRERLVALWLEMIETSDQMLMAGFRATLPSEAEARDAFRRWYEQYYREHYEHLQRMAERFNRLSQNHGRDGSTSNA